MYVDVEMAIFCLDHICCMKLSLFVTFVKVKIIPAKAAGGNHLLNIARKRDRPYVALFEVTLLK